MCIVCPLVKNANGRVVSYLAATEFLPCTNHTTVSQAVIRTLHSYEIDFGDIVVFDTDNAAYMKKAYLTVLSALCPNSIHVTCLAHIVNLVGESIRAPFKDLNQFVRAFSAMFYMAGCRKARYLAFLKAQGVSATMPPNPVATRWNSWFFAVQHHTCYFHLYSDFIEAEVAVCGKNAPQSVHTLHEMFSSPCMSSAIQAQINCVAEVSE